MEDKIEQLKTQIAELQRNNEKLVGLFKKLSGTIT